jgi:hypothetical protein
VFSKRPVPRKTNKFAGQSPDEQQFSPILNEAPAPANRLLTPDNVLQLQHLIGNRATENLLVQTKRNRHTEISRSKSDAATIQRDLVDLDEVYKEKAVNKTYFGDFKKIQALLSNATSLHKHLTLVENELKGGKVLSAILGEYAAKCGFSQQSPTLIGFVSPPRFLAMIRRGETFKDYGAPPGHGEFTHQLQWFVIMSEITNQFTVPKNEDWEHTPLDLYTAAGGEQYRSVVESATRYMWDHLVDRLTGGNYKLEVDGYASPEAFIADITADDPWLLTMAAPSEEKLTNLRAALKQRKEDREAAREGGGKGSGQAAVHALLYTRKKKAQFPDFKVEGRDEEKLIEIFYKESDAKVTPIEERIQQSKEKLFSAEANAAPSPAKTGGVDKDRQNLLIQEIQAQTIAIIDDFLKRTLPDEDAAKSDDSDEGEAKEAPLSKEKLEKLAQDLKAKYQSVEENEKDINEFYINMKQREENIQSEWMDAIMKMMQ